MSECVLIVILAVNEYLMLMSAYRVAGLVELDDLDRIDFGLLIGINLVHLLQRVLIEISIYLVIRFQ